jgi:hypothetical protein
MRPVPRPGHRPALTSLPRSRHPVSSITIAGGLTLGLTFGLGGCLWEAQGRHPLEPVAAVVEASAQPIAAAPSL